MTETQANSDLAAFQQRVRDVAQRTAASVPGARHYVDDFLRQIGLNGESESVTSDLAQTSNLVLEATCTIRVSAEDIPTSVVEQVTRYDSGQVEGFLRKALRVSVDDSNNHGAPNEVVAAAKAELVYVNMSRMDVS